MSRHTENLVYWLTEPPYDVKEAPWIVNIDLDYFFCKFDGGIRMMVSGDYIDSIASGLRIALDQGVIGVLTLCLTPDPNIYTLGWTETEALASRFLEHLGLTLKLPDAA